MNECQKRCWLNETSWDMDYNILWKKISTKLDYVLFYKGVWQVINYSENELIISGKIYCNKVLKITITHNNKLLFLFVFSSAYCVWQEKSEKSLKMNFKTKALIALLAIFILLEQGEFIFLLSNWNL